MDTDLHLWFFNNLSALLKGECIFWLLKPSSRMKFGEFMRLPEIPTSRQHIATLAVAAHSFIVSLCGKCIHTCEKEKISFEESFIDIIPVVRAEDFYLYLKRVNCNRNLFFSINILYHNFSKKSNFYLSFISSTR